MKTKINLTELLQERFNLTFDKRKINGFVRRCNNAGIPIYSNEHEDGPNTWPGGWSEDEYKNEVEDYKIFEVTELQRRNKPTFRSFERAQTYTAECAIFIFCPADYFEANKDLFLKP